MIRYFVVLLFDEVRYSCQLVSLEIKKLTLLSRFWCLWVVGCHSLVINLGFLKKYLFWVGIFTVYSTIQLLLQSCWTDFAKTVT